MNAEYKKIKWLFTERDVSAYEISKQTGISEALLSKYITGKSNIKNMTLETASKLTSYAEKQMLCNEYMVIRIEETGQLVSHRIPERLGSDWTRDIVLNLDSIVDKDIEYDKETGEYIVSSIDYIWLKEWLLDRMRKYDCYEGLSEDFAKKIKRVSEKYEIPVKTIYDNIIKKLIERSKKHEEKYKQLIEDLNNDINDPDKEIDQLFIELMELKRNIHSFSNEVCLI